MVVDAQPAVLDQQRRGPGPAGVECGGSLAAPPPRAAAAPAPAAPAPARFASPESYTPKHLAEKILTSRSVIEGERKQVTVMFTEVVELLAHHYERSAENEKAVDYAAADPQRRATWAYGTGFLHSITGAHPDVSIAYCREALAIAGANGLEEIRGFAECCLTHVYSVSGDLLEGSEAGQRALAIFEAQGNVWWSCRTLWGLMSVANGAGQWEQSLEYCRRALAYGQEVNDLRLKVVGWWRTASTHVQRGDPEAGLLCCEEALALSPIPIDAAMTRAVQGYCLVKLGKLGAGVAELTQVLEWLARSHLGHYRWFYGFWLAEGLLRLGEPARARALVEDILASSRSDSRRAEGIGERLLGESLMAENPAAPAGHLDAALRILEAIGAWNELARAQVSRGDLHRLAGDGAAARKLLDGAAPIFDRLGTLDEPARVRAALAALGAS